MDDPGSSSAISLGLKDAETIDSGIALDEAASALLSLVRWNIASFLLIYSAGGVGVDGPLFVGVDDDGDVLGGWRMVNARIQRHQLHFPAGSLIVVV